MKRWLRYEGVIWEVILHAGVGGCNDAEVHVILKDGTQEIFHLGYPTAGTIAILRDSTKKEIYVKVEVSKEAVEIKPKEASE